MKKTNMYISIILLISMILLAVLVPGGMIETRDFSLINPYILGTFNIFLTSLGIVSIATVFFIIKNKKWAFIVSFICGLMYFLVYVLDLTHIFPSSPDKMPILLFIIEVAGTVLSLPLMYLSLNKYANTQKVNYNKVISKKFIFLITFLIILGIGIVIFATKSAMGIR